MNTQITADLYKAPKTGPMAGPRYWLDINELSNGQRFTRETVGMSGKAEARRYAKALGATPWNF